jgi:hypothetical protein
MDLNRVGSGPASGWASVVGRRAHYNFSAGNRWQCCFFFSLTGPGKPILLVYPLTCGRSRHDWAWLVLRVLCGVLHHALGGVILRVMWSGESASGVAPGRMDFGHWKFCWGIILYLGILAIRNWGDVRSTVAWVVVCVCVLG